MLTNNSDSCMSQAGAIGPFPSLPQQPAILQPIQMPCCDYSPPAFLLKAYALVDDPNTNNIISWSFSGTSFIVWDHIRLAIEILPNYFIHNNFGSFVYQLNNYGFRKIGLQQWEYENQWFQRGNKQLLLNIKRRDKTSRVVKRRRRSKKNSIAVATNEIDSTQLENLRNRIADYKEELLKLKEQQALLQVNIGLLKQQIGLTKDSSLKIFKFIGKAFGGITPLKDVTQQIGEDTASKENDEIAENRLSSDNDQLMELNDEIPEENASKSYQENTFWAKFLEVNAQDENQYEPDFIRNQFRLTMELDDMMESNIGFIAENESKPPKIEAGEVNLRA